MSTIFSWGSTEPKVERLHPCV